MSIIASNNQLPELKPYDLVIVSSSREGLISAILQQTNSSKIPIGLILTGDPLPSEWMLNELQRSDHFVLSTTRNSQDVLITLSNFFAKIQSQDTAKIHEAIALVQKYVDLKHLVRNCIS
jgi:BioD-like phosphotransacetylase family protein